MVAKSNGLGDSPAKPAAGHKPAQARKAPAKVSAKSRERKTSCNASR
jgi:hypothetical protein